MGVPQRIWTFWRAENISPAPGTEQTILGCPVRSLATIPTAVSGPNRTMVVVAMMVIITMMMMMMVII
jgi:hypothetical protein